MYITTHVIEKGFEKVYETFTHELVHALYNIDQENDEFEFIDKLTSILMNIEIATLDKKLPVPREFPIECPKFIKPREHTPRALNRESLLAQLEKDKRELERIRHEIPRKWYERLRRELEQSEFMIKYGVHGDTFIEVTRMELDDLRKRIIGSRGETLGYLIKRTVQITIKDVLDFSFL